MFPETPKFGYISLCSATADQTALTDMSLAPASKIPIEPEANSMEFRFFAKHTTNDCANDTSRFECYGYPLVNKTNESIGLGLLLFDVLVTWSAGIYTVHPLTAAAGDWSEADNISITCGHGAVLGGNYVNDRGMPLLVDVRGLGYIYVVCDDITIDAATVDEVLAIGRGF